MEVPEAPGVRFDVQGESNRVGFDWIIQTVGGMRCSRWEYILAMDIIVGEVRAVAVRGLQESQLHDHEEKKKHSERVETQKFCNTCRKHTGHKEVK